MPIGQVQLILRVINMVNCVLIIAVYPLRFSPVNFLATTSADPVENFPTYFLTVYTIVFALIFCCFEADLPFVRDQQARYFRFMYNYLSRFLFMFFIASLCLVSNYWLGYVAGGVTVLNALFNAGVLLVHPGWKIKHLLRDPTQQYTSTLQAAKGAALDSARFVQDRNPNLAADVGKFAQRSASQAGSAAMQFARENPDAVRGVTERAGSVALDYAKNNPEAAFKLAAAASQAMPAGSAEDAANPFG
jgi:hypothetical protein